MKASEMTNEELAKELEDGSSQFDPCEDDCDIGTHEILREAAARLRQFDERTNKSCYAGLKSSVCSVYSCKRDGDCAACEYGEIRAWAASDANAIAGLRAKLKVAVDALEKLQDRLVSSVHDGTIDPHEALEIAENALAAIREKGGANA